MIRKGAFIDIDSRIYDAVGRWGARTGRHVFTGSVNHYVSDNVGADIGVRIDFPYDTWRAHDNFQSRLRFIRGLGRVNVSDGDRIGFVARFFSFDVRRAEQQSRDGMGS